jgi:uncharacterized protein
MIVMSDTSEPFGDAAMLSIIHRPQQASFNGRAIKYVSTPVPAGAQVILRSVVGSTVHGTSIAEVDDHDEMALVIEPRSHVLGLSHWETTLIRTQGASDRSGPGDLDLVVHSVRKYARLAVRGNPTILLLLFSKPLYASQAGQALLSDRDVFLSRRAGQAFLGYMHAQRMRLSGQSGGRHGAPRTELVERYGYDTKYAGHIIRLGYQGIELLMTGRMSLPMLEAERTIVRSIRLGEWTLGQVLTLGEELEARLKACMHTSPLPEDVSEAAVNRVLEDLHEAAWYLRFDEVDPA